jgi:hypothetical protein
MLAPCAENKAAEYILVHDALLNLGRPSIADDIDTNGRRVDIKALPAAALDRNTT